MKDLNELRRERGNLIQECRALNDKAGAEKRSFTAEEQVSYDKMFNKSEELRTEIKREEDLRSAEREAGVHGRVVPSADLSASKDSSEKRYQEVIRPLLSKFFSRSSKEFTSEESRALQADLSVSGGYLKAPMQFVTELIKGVDDMTFIRKLATVQTLTESDSLGAPSLDADVDDYEESGEISEAAEDTAMGFGRRELKPHGVKKLLKVANKLLRLVPNAESLVRERMAYKLGVTQEKGFLVGTGASGKSLGVFTASDAGITTARDVATDNTATAIAADNLKECKYTLKSQYWPRAQWVGHRDWLKRVDKLKDSEGQYLWQPGLVAGRQDTLLGFPINISEFAPNTFTAGQYVAVLGDFKYYWIADVLSIVIQRLDELYARNSQTGFMVEAHYDGMPVLAEAFVRSKMGA